MCSQIYENSKKNLNLILRAGKQKVKKQYPISSSKYEVINISE